MAEDARNLPGEALRETMRRWATGVAVVTAREGERRHGMTVNSFTSVSLDPPLVTVTLARRTRTHALVQSVGRFGVTILAAEQAHISDVFSGRVAEGGDRFDGLEIFEIAAGVPLLAGGLAGLVCRVEASHSLPHSTLFIGWVETAWQRDDGLPLIYLNRAYHQLGG
jgi:flavin reductase (DIM6/NTAB) family NADH-FMN oxidoreductase RutF